MKLLKEINNRRIEYRPDGSFFLLNDDIQPSGIKYTKDEKETLKENHIKELTGISPEFINFYFRDIKELENFLKNKDLLESFKSHHFTYRIYIDYFDGIEDNEVIKEARLFFMLNKIQYIFLYYVKQGDELLKNIDAEYILKIDINKEYDYLFDKINLSTLKKYVDKNNIKGAEIILDNLDQEKLKDIRLLENVYQTMEYVMNGKIFKINFLELFYNSNNNTNSTNNTNNNDNNINTNNTNNNISVIKNKGFEKMLSNYILSFIDKEDKYVNIDRINELEVANFFTILLLNNRSLLHYTINNKKTYYLMTNNFFNTIYLAKNFYIENDYIKILGYDGKSIQKLELVENIQEIILAEENINFIYNNSLYMGKEFLGTNTLPEVSIVDNNKISKKEQKNNIEDNIYRKTFNKIVEKILDRLL